jgi:hypothetical protein
MKKKILIIGAILLATIVFCVWAIPAFADDSTSSMPSSAPQVNKIRILARLLLVQDESKVDALIAKALDADKITAEQAVKIKDFWTKHHQQFTRRVVLRRLLRAQDGTKVQTFLNKAVAAGKIQQEQADKIMTIWNELHSK